MAPIQIYYSISRQLLSSSVVPRNFTMKSWEAEGLSIDDKYEIEEYREMMKAFADAATEGNLDQVLRYSTCWSLNLVEGETRSFCWSGD